MVAIASEKRQVDLDAVAHVKLPRRTRTVFLIPGSQPFDGLYASLSGSSGNVSAVMT